MRKGTEIGVRDRTAAAQGGTEKAGLTHLFERWEGVGLRFISSGSW